MNNTNNIEVLRHQIIEMFNSVEKEFLSNPPSSRTTLAKTNVDEASFKDSVDENLDNLLNQKITSEGAFTNINTIIKNHNEHFLGDFFSKDFKQFIKIHFDQNKKISKTNLFHPLNLINKSIVITGILHKQNNEYTICLKSEHPIKILGKDFTIS